MNYLVVGADSGIGENIVSQLNQQGNNVIKTSRRRGQKGSDVLYFDATSTKNLDFPEMALDGMVYMPGTINLKPFNRLSDQNFMDDFKVNLLGAVKAIRQVLPHLKKTGTSSIVLFSSVAASKGFPYHASIAAAKAAVEGLGRSLAAEFAPGIRVNSIAVSLTDTPLASKLLSSEQRRSAAEHKHPLKKIGKPEDIASLAVYLLTNKSSWITGQVFRFDGGLSTFGS